MITKRYLQNLSALMMLLAVNKYQSKRKVAEHINTSIDTVNKYLRNLEQNLGLQLIVNSTSGCKLTPRAQIIVEKLQDISDIVEQIYHQQPADKKYEGDVSVCLPLAANANFFLYDVSNFFENYPDIKVTFLSTYESSGYEDVGADVAIVFAFDEQSKHYSLLHCKNIETGLFASPEYLKKYGYPKDMKDLIKNHRLAGQIVDFKTSSDWKNILTQAEHYSFASNSNYAVSEAIRKGLGIGVMPKKICGDELISLDNLNFSSSLPLYLVVNNNTRRIPRVKAVAEYYCRLIDNM